MSTSAFAKDGQLEARIESFEMAFKMQTEATDAFDISRESAETRALYTNTKPAEPGVRGGNKQDPLGMKLLYSTVDAMWRAAGDTSTDFNFYTKRAILSAVYSSTLMRWLAPQVSPFQPLRVTMPCMPMSGANGPGLKSEPAAAVMPASANER